MDIERRDSLERGRLISAILGEMTASLMSSVLCPSFTECVMYISLPIQEESVSSMHTGDGCLYKLSFHVNIRLDCVKS